MEESWGLPGRRRKVFAAFRSVRRSVQAEDRVYNSLITAKKSSIRTVVSGSESGVWVRGIGGGLAGDDVDSREDAEGRRGSGGTESIDARGAFCADVGSEGFGELL
jgi:hypothetical protein